MDLIGLDVEYQHGTGNPTQVAIVNAEGNILFNEYFTVRKGIALSTKKKQHLKDKDLKEYSVYKPVILELLANKTVVGHDLTHDFKALDIDIRNYNVIDTAKIKDFMQISFQSRALKNLSKNFLGKNIQGSSSHNASEDAKTAMELVNLYKKLQMEQPEIPDLLEFVQSSNMSKNLEELDWTTELPPIPEQTLNEFMKRSTIHKMDDEPLIQFPPSPILKTATNYAKNMEGLHFNSNLIQFSKKPNMYNTSSNLIQFSNSKPSSNYAKNMEGLYFPKKTALNYAKNMEGLTMQYVPKNMSAFNSIKGNKSRKSLLKNALTKLKKTFKQRH